MLHRWSLGMNRLFCPIIHDECNYVSMLGLKLIHVSIRGQAYFNFLMAYAVYTRQWACSPMVQAMVCRLFGSNTLTELVVTSRQLDMILRRTFSEIWIRYNEFLSHKCIKTKRSLFMISQTLVEPGEDIVLTWTCLFRITAPLRQRNLGKRVVSQPKCMDPAHGNRRRYNVASQITKFMGPTCGPPGSCRPQMGPMLAPWALYKESSLCGWAPTQNDPWLWFLEYLLCKMVMKMSS